MSREFSACFTGHRELFEDGGAIKKRLIEEIEKLIARGVINFFAGGALGFDTLAATCVLELRQKYPHIALNMLLPHREQSRNWSEYDRRVYAFILEEADRAVCLAAQYHRGCMQTRNRRLVECSSYCIAYLKNATGGTAYTVKYALKKGLEVINIAER